MNFPVLPVLLATPKIKTPNTRTGLISISIGARRNSSRSSSSSASSDVYRQITSDSGELLVLASFESRVAGIGRQIGYTFPIGKMQGSLNLRGYGEFAAANQPSGWNTWLTFEISEPPPENPVGPTRHLVTK